MERDLGIQWRQESPSLHAAYVTPPQGRKVYVGYVATGPGDDAWRGYRGVNFTPVGRGSRQVVQAAVEQTVRAVGGAARERCGSGKLTTCRSRATRRKPCDGPGPRSATACPS